MKGKSLVLLAGAAMGLATGAALANDADRAYRAELLADAQQRSSLLAAGATLSHDGHFGFTDATGNNTMTVFLYSDYRHFFNLSEVPSSDGTADITHGGQLNRVQLGFHGNVASPDFQYWVLFGASGLETISFSDDSDSSTPSLGLLEATATWFFNGDQNTYLHAGQGRPLQALEMSHRPWDVQAFERSLLSAATSINRTHFVGIGYQDEQWRGEVNFIDGMQDTSDFFSSSEADFGFVGAVHFLVDGTWDTFNYQGAEQGVQSATAIGGYAHWQSGGDTGISTADVDIFTVNLGVEHKGDGYNVFAEGMFQSIDPAFGSSIDTWGFHIQGGFALDAQTEIYAGLTGFFLDDDFFSDEEHFRAILGVTHHPFAGTRAVRVGAEASFFFDDNFDLLSYFDALDSEFNASWFSQSAFNILGDSDNDIGFGFRVTVNN
ncbi:MAG: hypothetical protein H6811_08920 [Phycisphaeraceae bacterium]|nr:hypothetical protein [Phycisphaeraceae bacterium]